VALEALAEIERTSCFAAEVLERRLSRLPSQERRDRALAWELVLGTLRWRGRIDYLLSRLLTRPLASVPVEIRNALRLGAYQILFLDRVPERAAVSESVELARTYGHEGHVRFVNGVLRNLARRKEELDFPDPREPVPFLAATRSFPEWLVRRWVERLGPEEAGRLMDACNRRPPLILRVNTLKVSVEEFLVRLREQGRTAERHPLAAEAVEVGGGVEGLPGYREGWFYVQDPGAMLVSRLLGAKPGERILDACAAPGGKTSHLAQIMHDRGTVTVLESDPGRLNVLRENMERLGISSVTPCLGDAAAADFSAPFDRVLIDAPCSGLGTLRRHPEAKWQKRGEDLLRHRERQIAILWNLARFVKPGGSLVYAVCSLEPEESDEVVTAFLRRHPHFVLDKRPAHLDPAVQTLFDDRGFFRTWPHHHRADGFFAARLLRAS